MCVFVHFREIEYLKKETAQRRAQEESEATHKEETDNLQEKVRSRLTWISHCQAAGKAKETLITKAAFHSG